MNNNPIFFLLLPAVFAGCASGATYFPNVQNVPLVQSEDDFLISAHIDVEEIGGGHLQFAKPVANRFIVMGNFLYRDYGNCDDCRTYKRSFGEVGLGYYFPNEKEAGRVTEVFAGFGTGNSETLESKDYFAGETIHAKGRYNRVFLQANQGLRKRTSEIAGSIRVSTIHFVDYDEYVTSKRPNNDANWRIFLEPAFTGRIGFENLKLSGQIGFSLPVTKKSNFKSRNGWVTIGLQVNLRQMGQKK